jgi:hypothetical protein
MADDNYSKSEENLYLLGEEPEVLKFDNYINSNSQDSIMSNNAGVPRPRLVFVLPTSDKDHSADDGGPVDVVTQQPEELENSEIILNVLSDSDCSTDTEGSGGEEGKGQEDGDTRNCLPSVRLHLSSDTYIPCVLVGSVTVIVFLLAFNL